MDKLFELKRQSAIKYLSTIEKKGTLFAYIKKYYPEYILDNELREVAVFTLLKDLGLSEKERSKIWAKRNNIESTIL